MAVFLVGGVNRLVNFVDDRDLCLQNCVKYDSYLITGFIVQSAHFQKLPLPVYFSDCHFYQVIFTDFIFQSANSECVKNYQLPVLFLRI